MSSEGIERNPTRNPSDVEGTTLLSSSPKQLFLQWLEMDQFLSAATLRALLVSYRLRHSCMQRWRFCRKRHVWQRDTGSHSHQNTCEVNWIAQCRVGALTPSCDTKKHFCQQQSRVACVASMVGVGDRAQYAQLDFFCCLSRTQSPQQYPNEMIKMKWLILLSLFLSKCFYHGVDW